MPQTLLQHSGSTNGFVIRDFRCGRGLTVDELANRTLISAPHIRNFENGWREANDVHLARIAQALEVRFTSLRRTGGANGVQQNGDAIRDGRLMRGLSRAELADRISVSESHIRNIENEQKDASDVHLAAIAHVLQMRLSSFRRVHVAEPALIGARS